MLRLGLGPEAVLELPRGRGRAAAINFRDVVGPLPREPGAFVNYQYREQLHRRWWREVLTRLLGEFPNGNAVSQTPS